MINEANRGYKQKGQQDSCSREAKRDLPVYQNGLLIKSITWMKITHHWKWPYGLSSLLFLFELGDWKCVIFNLFGWKLALFKVACLRIVLFLCEKRKLFVVLIRTHWLSQVEWIQSCLNTALNKYVIFCAVSIDKWWKFLLSYLIIFLSQWLKILIKVLTA